MSFREGRVQFQDEGTENDEASIPLQRTASQVQMKHIQEELEELRANEEEKLFQIELAGLSRVS